MTSASQETAKIIRVVSTWSDFEREKLIRPFGFKGGYLTELLDKILPAVINEGVKITGKSDLNINFVYNALVSVDNAAWCNPSTNNILVNSLERYPLSPYNFPLIEAIKRSFLRGSLSSACPCVTTKLRISPLSLTTKWSLKPKKPHG